MIAETVCSAVSVAGLGIAAITAYRKRFLRAARIVAYSLVPVALVMTGIVKWLADTAFSPTAWAGFAVLAIAWLLFMTTRAIERRTGGTRKERRAAEKAARREAVAPAASAPSLSTAARPAAEPVSRARTERPAPASSAAPAPRGSSKSGDDFSDVEEILKKHGI
jgi:hypothetical protein